MALYNTGLVQDDFSQNDGMMTPNDLFFSHQELFGAPAYPQTMLPTDGDLEQTLIDQATFEQAILAGLEINVEEATPRQQPSPCDPSGSRMAPDFIKVPVMDFSTFDMTFSHSPLGSPLDELQQSMLMFNSANNSPTYPENFYMGRRSSTPACFTDLMAMMPSFANQDHHQHHPVSSTSVPPLQCNPTTTTTAACAATGPAPTKPMSRRASVSGASAPRSRRNSNASATSSSKPDSPTKIYCCTEPGCTKLFKRSEHLKRHLKSIHSDDKPFPCPFPKCDKKFSRSDNLAQHMRIHRDPSDKARSKGFTSATPFVLSMASDLEEQMAYPVPL